jgi:hypothetical protein
MGNVPLRPMVLQLRDKHYALWTADTLYQRARAVASLSVLVH